MKPLVINTRPGEAGHRLQSRLQQAGRDAAWWPAFDIGPAPDVGHARRTLAALAGFDLAIFVSPVAVRAAAGLMAQPWPAGTAIGAVGAATAAAVAEELRLPSDVPVIAPAAHDDTGSEAFMAEWQRQRRVARRVLIVRAQHGREWLAQRFAEGGSLVEVLAVYVRIERGLDASAQQWLTGAVAANVPVATVFSSSEAIAALDRGVKPVAGACEWLRQGVAIATHPRVAGQLLAAGYSRVATASADDATVLAQLESL